MKVFLSWSGPASHKVALAFKEWLPNVIQVIDPYVSSENIDKGTRWFEEISKELESSFFGILCVTPYNKSELWLIYEAGALSKLTSSKVCPFLFDLSPSDILKSPLYQFQCTEYKKENIWKLLCNINKSNNAHPIEGPLLRKAFEKWWPELHNALESIKTEMPDLENEEIKDTEATDRDLLEEILKTVNNQSRTIAPLSDWFSAPFTGKSLGPDSAQRIGGAIPYPYGFIARLSPETLIHSTGMETDQERRPDPRQMPPLPEEIKEGLKRRTEEENSDQDAT